MNPTALETLKRFYSGSEDWILIVNESWEVLWSTRADRIPELRQSMILPEDCWENVTRPFVQGDQLFHCYVRCSREDGLRVMQFQPALNSSLDFAAITSIVQAMISTCTALYYDLDKHAARESRRYLNVLMADILRIYRMLYIELELQRGQDGQWDAAAFGLLSVIEPICKELQELIPFSSVSLSCEEKGLFAHGDAKGFQAAAISALLLCFRESEQPQAIRISLHREETKAVLHFEVSYAKQKRLDLDSRRYDFGDILPEKSLLEQYCNAFEIVTAFESTESGTVCRMEIPLAKPDTLIQLCSTPGRVESGYFEPIPVMLARIRLREFF